MGLRVGSFGGSLVILCRIVPRKGRGLQSESLLHQTFDDTRTHSIAEVGVQCCI